MQTARGLRSRGSNADVRVIRAPGIDNSQKEKHLSILSKRRSVRKVAALSALAMSVSALALAAPAGATQTVEGTRETPGADRYATAANLALASFTSGSNNIILVSGENFADGVSAAGLAGRAQAPILLTQAASLPASTLNAIAALDSKAPGAATVHIIGGTSAISSAVRSQLTSLGYTLNEISGTNRYDTSAKVATFAASLAPIGSYTAAGGTSKRTAIVASGASFADALAAGPIAYKGAHPIILTDSASLSAEASAALSSILAQQVIILGGTSAVSDAVKTAIEAKGISTIRVFGADRYETAANLAAIADNAVGAGATQGGFGFDNTKVGLVSGTSFADALAAAPYSGRANVINVLVGSGTTLPAATSAFITANNATISKVNAIGGTSAVSAEQLTAAVAAATTVTPTATITAEQGRSSFTVTFSEAVSVTSASTSANVVFARAGATVSASTATAVNADSSGRSTTWTISGITATGGGTTLAAGDVITVKAGTGTTANGRASAAATATVAADTTRPTVTSLTVPVGSTTGYVTFSETMSSATSAAWATVTSGTVSAVTLVSGSTYAITFASALTAGQTVTIPDVAVDLAGNKVVSTSKIVALDTVAPTITKAVVSTTASASATVALTPTATTAAITFTAVKASAAGGVAGNAWGIKLTDTDGAALAIAVDNANKLITVTGDFAGSGAATNVQFVTAWAASAANALFTADITAVGSMAGTTTSAVTASGGNSVSKIAVTFSEPVNLAGGTTLSAFTSNSVFATSVNYTTTASNPVLTATADYTRTLTGSDASPVAGTAEIRATGGLFSDLSTNPNTNQTVTISAS